MLQLTQRTRPVLPSAARAGQSETAQPPPPRSLVHLPAAATPLVPLFSDGAPSKPVLHLFQPESPTSRSQDLL